MFSETMPCNSRAKEVAEGIPSGSIRCGARLAERDTFRGPNKETKRGGESGVEGHVTGPYTSRSLRPHAGYRAVGGAVALVLEFNVTLCNIARRWSTLFLPLRLGSQTMKVQRRDATVGCTKISEFRILGSLVSRPKHEL